MIRIYQRVASRRWLACTAVFVFVIAARTALIPWQHVPMPAVHDEFSYLLAGDTFAHGRLANPTHPFWQHFETFHVLQQPTYASKYQPAQGLVLAFGEKLFGLPWIGVLVSTALMCAVICWMLQGWISPGLALLGGLLAGCRIGILSYWMNSYWGGSVPAIGGALMLGAVARIVFRKQYAHAVTWAAGLVILLNSRPYDGAVLGLVSGAALVWLLVRDGAALGRYMIARSVLAAATVLAVAAGFMAYYNYSVTGKALELAYQEHDRQYAVASMLAWGGLRPEPVYHHAVMRKLWAVWHVQEVQEAKRNLAAAFMMKLGDTYDFVFGLYPLLIPLLIWPYPMKSTEERLTVFLLGGFLVALLPITGFAPHYAAAIVGLLYVRFLQSVDRLRAWRPGGRPLGIAAAVFFVALIPAELGRDLVALGIGGELAPRLALARQQVVRQLEKEPGRQLVLVHYAPDHNIHEEWVYNSADVDGQPIVWAREMGPEQDRPFIQYFRDRQVWLLEADQSPPRLERYDSPQASTQLGRSSAQ